MFSRDTGPRLTPVQLPMTFRKSAEDSGGEELNSQLFSSIPHSRKTSRLVGRNFG
ncbi:UNVERIFIED_CONTAM: hypothetical protein FKN15_015964 [Acipenser sinensis]